MRIPIYRRDEIVAHAIVDACDYDTLAQHRWRLLMNTSGTRYATRYTDDAGKTVTQMMHRVILGLAAGDARQSDHINGDGLDNRRENLRIVTQQENHQNLRAQRGARSQFRGVSQSGAKWRARGKINGVQHHIGYFTVEAEAGEAASAWRLVNMPYTNEARSGGDR